MGNVFNDDFIKALNNNKVNYIVVGGYAVIFNGFNRTTRVIDIRDLLANKKAVGRSKDINDIENLNQKNTES